MSSKRRVAVSYGGGKKARKSLCLELKLEVIRRIEKGERQVDICNAFSLAGSTVRTILKNKNKIEKYGRLSSPSESVRFVKNRSPIMIEMERLLGIWIDDQIRRNCSIRSLLIQEKAKNIYENLKAKAPASSDAEMFKASAGWLERFKRRANLHETTLQGDIGSSDEGGARFESDVKYESHYEKDDKKLTSPEPKDDNEHDFISEHWSTTHVKCETCTEKDDESNTSVQLSSCNSENENLTAKADYREALKKYELNPAFDNEASVSEPQIQSPSLEHEDLSNNRAHCNFRNDLSALEITLPLNSQKNDKSLEKIKCINKNYCPCLSKESCSSASSKRMDKYEEINIDEDKLFLMSLLPPLKRLPPDVKSSIKLTFQQIMHETTYGKLKPSTNHNNSPPCSPYAVNRYMQNPIPEVIIHNSNPLVQIVDKPSVNKS